MENRDHQQMNLDKSHACFYSYTEPLGFSQMETVKSFGQPLFRKRYLNKEGKPRNPLLKLNRIRDFISLWLSYPMRTAHDSKLKAWIHEVSNIHGLIEEKYRLMRENPLRYVEGLLPVEMIVEIEAGGNSLFADENEIPKAILNLAADLAVDQLVQTLLSGDDHVRNIHYVMLSTRNGVEQREVFEKIKVLSKDKDNKSRFNEIFHRVLCVDVSMHQSQGEITVLQEIRRQLRCQLQLQLPMSKLYELQLQGMMMSKKYLVLLLDGDAEKAIDLRKVVLPTYIHDAIMVSITAESSKQANDDITLVMDLKISTEDHLLPWEVFCQNVANELVYSSSAIQRIAVRIVEECGGHLLAIVLVAKSLKNVKDIKLWELALIKLRYLNPLSDLDMFQSVSRVMVNTFINFIWNDITQTQKSCLTSCLFISDIKIGKLHFELMYHWTSYQLIDDGKAAHILRELVERSILLQLQGFKGRYIQLPEETYAILHSLNTLDPLFIKKSGLGLTEPPDDELWQSAVHMELINNRLCELPLSPNSLELKVLRLQGNADLTSIPPMFFFNMPLLQIIDLSNTSIRELPNSLFELKHLRELYLKGCECFMKLSPKIGKLNKLEKLDLDGTQIIHLPEEMQELTSLQSLTLCFYEYRGKKNKQYTCSTIIPHGVISKLKCLKHLSIDVNPDDERWYENVPGILPEILGLKSLITLSLYIPQLELLKLIPDYISDLDFRFIVGKHMQRIISGKPPTYEAKFMQSDYRLKFVKGVDIPDEIKKLVRHSKALFLDRHVTIKNLSEFGLMNLEQLRVCMLAECKEMQTVVDGRHSNNDNDVLSHLLYLSVSYMLNLKSIWDGPAPPRCFLGMLKSLVLHNCPKLTTVFTLEFLGNLSLLKELIVNNCPKVRTLISDKSRRQKAEIFLPKLKKLLLLHLPKLINISNGFHMGPCLENIGIYDCPKLQSLSMMELSSQNLRVIKGESKWWATLKWHEGEWGKAGRPSKFDCFFSSINVQVDIMTQLGVEDEVEDGQGREVGDPLQPAGKRILKDQKQSASADRRLTNSVSKETSEGVRTLENGYIWRKYGQKDIVGAKFPRSYYRCAHGHCSAKKQVQRSEVDPTIYETSYEGRHTCTHASSDDDLFVSRPSSALLESFSSMDDSVFTQDMYLKFSLHKADTLHPFR